MNQGAATSVFGGHIATPHCHILDISGFLHHASRQLHELLSSCCPVLFLQLPKDFLPLEYGCRTLQATHSFDNITICSHTIPRSALFTIRYIDKTVSNKSKNRPST